MGCESGWQWQFLVGLTVVQFVGGGVCGGCGMNGWSFWWVWYRWWVCG